MTGLRYILAVLISQWMVVCVFAESPSTSINFARDIQPLLSDNCFFCHGPDPNDRQADLRLDLEESAHEAVIQPGHPGDSDLISRITSDDPDVVMPPPDSGKTLTNEQIAKIREWIKSGAEYEQHWAFQPVRAAEVIANGHPVDHFVNRRLKHSEISPNPIADRRTLARRASLDLTGLPPNLDDAERFIQDQSDDAWSQYIDRLLAAPAYGERMAWDWLDAARYADTNGYQGDNDRTMWPWRDWVVKSFNENKPWDQFTREQIAGDLIPDAADDQVMATGFLRNHMINGEGGRIAEENRVEYVFDMAETVGTVWMGMTFQCCRCHDHKFDALTQQDYYTLNAFFNQTPVDGGGGNGQTAPVLSYINDDSRAQIAKVDLAWQTVAKQLEQLESKSNVAENGGELPAEVKKDLGKQVAARSVEDMTTIRDHYKKLKENNAAAKNNDEATDPPPVAEEPKWLVRYLELCEKSIQTLNDRKNIDKRLPKVMVMRDRDKPRKTFILDRGLYNQPGEEVTAATPVSMSPLPKGKPANRLALADWIIDPDNPLTARVTVNRFWQMLFGTGLVKTTEDFGVQGEYPSHPELLDWLADDFVKSGWDVKHLLKQIMTSRTYQRSSHVTEAMFEADPKNRLLGRGARFRMPSWMIRDQALAVSGLINADIGGPSVNSYQPKGVWQETTFGKKTHNPDEGEALYRRSLYVFWRRIIGPTIFFDSGKRQVCEVKTTRTNTPLHSLTTLNAVTYVEAARALAERVMIDGGEPAEQIARATKLVLLRDVTNDEAHVWRDSLSKATAYYEKHPELANQFLSHGESKRNDKLDAVQHAAMATVCLNLLNLDETVTKE